MHKPPYGLRWWGRPDPKPALADKAPRRFRVGRWLLLAILATAAWVVFTPATQAQNRQDERGSFGNGRPNAALPNGAQPGQPAQPAVPANGLIPNAPDVDRMLSPGGMSSTLKILAMLTVLSLAPSILMMTTCFIRFVIVLGLLRQAMGTQQLPPNQVIVSLSLFLTFAVMAPVWKEAYNDGIRPYTQNQPIPGMQRGEDPLHAALRNTARPLRRFMSRQIEAAGNSDAVWLFLEYQKPPEGTEAARNYKPPENYDQVDLSVLLPSYMLSELKAAFIIGFQIFLPFLVIDMVIASVLISMGMMMLPPVLISLPFKLLLFVLIDGWYLTVGMLMESVRPLG